MVVAVSGVSYISYLLRLWWGEDRGLIIAGLLGGAYSSTVTTVVLARQSKKREPCAVGFAGAIVAATGMMYIRLWILLLLFAAPLAYRLTSIFWGLGLRPSSSAPCSREASMSTKNASSTPTRGAATATRSR